MKTKLKKTTELRELQENFSEVQQLANKINDLKIVIINKIDNLKENDKKEENTNKGTFSRTEQNNYKYQEKENIKEATELLVNRVERRNRVHYEKEIKVIRNKFKEIQNVIEHVPKRQLKKSQSSEIYLTERPTDKFKKGDTIRIVNYHIERYGDLFGKTGIVHTVGKACIFINIPNIPVLQQRTESSLELVDKAA